MQSGLPNAVARSIDRNNFSHSYMGEIYSQLVEDSPYTRDMKEIDKDYLKIFLDACKRHSERYCRL